MSELISSILTSIVPPYRPLPIRCTNFAIASLFSYEQSAFLDILNLHTFLELMCGHHFLDVLFSHHHQFSINYYYELFTARQLLKLSVCNAMRCTSL